MKAYQTVHDARLPHENETRWRPSSWILKFSVSRRRLVSESRAAMAPITRNLMTD